MIVGCRTLSTLNISFKQWIVMFLHLKKYICSPCLDMCMFSKLLKYCITIIQYFQYLMMIMSFSKYLALISVHVTNFCWWNSTLISNIYFLSDILNNQYICGDIFSLWNHIFSQMYFHTLFCDYTVWMHNTKLHNKRSNFAGYVFLFSSNFNAQWTDCTVVCI